MSFAALLPPHIAAQVGGQLLDDQVLGDPAARAIVERMAAEIDPLFVARPVASTGSIVVPLLAAFDNDAGSVIAAVKERARMRLMDPHPDEPAAARAAFGNLRSWGQAQIDIWRTRSLSVDPAVEQVVAGRLTRLFKGGDDDGIVRLLEGTLLAAEDQKVATARVALELCHAPPAGPGERIISRETRQAIGVFIDLVKSPLELAGEVMLREIDAAQGYVAALALMLEPDPPRPLAA
jgi:hypothetical protein